eukprot:gene24093-31303_t
MKINIVEVETEGDSLSILSVLRENAQLFPSKKLYTFLSPNKTSLGLFNEIGSLTYSEFYNKSFTLATALRPHASQKDRILLVYPPSLDFIVAFIGCLIAGFIPVPVFPPDPSFFYQYSSASNDNISNCSSSEFSAGKDKRAREIHVFDSIKVSCGAKVVLTNKLYRDALKRVTNLNAALKLELNAVSIFSDQYSMFDLTWIASDELITLNNTGTESYSAEKFLLILGIIQGKTVGIHPYMYYLQTMTLHFCNIHLVQHQFRRALS